MNLRDFIASTPEPDDFAIRYYAVAPPFPVYPGMPLHDDDGNEVGTLGNRLAAGDDGRWVFRLDLTGAEPE